MPWHVGRNGDCPVSKPYAVIRNGTSLVEGCHPTREAAEKQLAALYATGKAAWSSAYINDLPDGAFACTRGDERFYPHHDASGALDLPHLRAALSRIGDPDNEQCGKGHLEAHANAQQLGERGKALAPMKATALDDDAFRLLAFPFGGPIPDPHFPRGVDVDRQTFSERTDIKRDWFDVRLVDWHHGQDETLGRTVLGKATDIGRFEGASSEPDDDGWWVTVWLKAGERRTLLIKRLAEQATVYGSSETAPGLGAVKAADGSVVPWRRHIPGEIVRWPYIRQALSTSPQNTYSIIRPLKATLDDLVSEGELPAAAFWSDLEAAMRDLSLDLRSTSLGESVAKAGRVLSGANEADIKQALDAARAALERLETVVRRQPDYSMET